MLPMSFLNAERDVSVSYRYGCLRHHAATRVSHGPENCAGWKLSKGRSRQRQPNERRKTTDAEPFNGVFFKHDALRGGPLVADGLVS